MPLDDLLSAMRAEADEELARLERESRGEAEEILEAANRDARAIEADVLRAAGAELEAELARRRSRGRLEARRILHAAREQAFAELIDDLRVRLGSVRESSGPYRALFAELLRESFAALPMGRRLWVDPRDEPLARELSVELDAELELRPELGTAGGLNLESDDGRLLRNTLEARLAAAEPVLRLRFGALVAELDGARRAGERSAA